MPEGDNTPAPPAPTGGQEPPGAPNPAPTPPGETGSQPPPWGDDASFNPERAWSLIQNLRTEGTQSKAARDALQQKVDEFESANKTELEKLNERASGAETRAGSAEHKLLQIEVALAKGIPYDQAHRLAGTSREELETDADTFVAAFQATPEGGTKPPPSGRPTPNTPRSGMSNDTPPPETDPAKLAEMVTRGNGI